MFVELICLCCTLALPQNIPLISGGDCFLLRMTFSMVQGHVGFPCGSIHSSEGASSLGILELLLVWRTSRAPVDTENSELDYLHLYPSSQ